MQWRTALPVERPSVVVLAGPNGAGKSTLAGQLLVDVLGVSQFVDADLLARSLALSETAPLTAGRAMLRRLDELTRARQSFGFETTLRYRSGLRNFFHLYQALTTTWRMYDNSTHQPRLIASGAGRETLTVNELHLWQRIRAEAGHAG